jgi:hypothetical protein
LRAHPDKKATYNGAHEAQKLFLAGGANRAQSRQQTRRDCGNNLRPIKAVVNDLTNAFGKAAFQRKFEVLGIG